ncbi:dTDP-glucose 4,6-dehydratase [Candidatus Uhrbacteria bacterium]|nr:dTDP-glucose 4,6-dehydratase [Candidatus Uhrbacteria bacterium]
MKFLITGGLGFMGSNMIRYVLNTYQDCSILNLDKMTYAANPKNLKDVSNNSRYRFMKGDVADEDLIEKVFGEFDPDIVLNYAAESHVDRSIMDPKAFLVTAALGTYTLLEATRAYKTPRFIQISTDEVFGSIEQGSFTETSCFEPNSPYSAAKAGGDLLCRAYIKTYNLPIIVTHSCNFIGPYQYPEKVIPLFITNLLEGKKVPLYGDGKNVREWIYTEDHCRAIDALMQKGVVGEVYNIGTGQEIQNIDLTKKILTLLGKGEEMIEPVKDRPAHDRRYSIDSSKLRALGWKSEYSLDQALEKTIKWYQTHEDWWKPLKSGEYLEYYNTQYQRQ